jgi:hypothetical protein
VSDSISRSEVLTLHLRLYLGFSFSLTFLVRINALKSKHFSKVGKTSVDPILSLIQLIMAFDPTSTSTSPSILFALHPQSHAPLHTAIGSDDLTPSLLMVSPLSLRETLPASRRHGARHSQGGVILLLRACEAGQFLD